ncbi:hypothetical protein JCM13664_05740 [Methylothermus subterraneus]
MSEALRFERLTRWIAERERQAASALAAAVRKLEEAQTRLATLQRFRREYLQQWLSDGVAVSALEFFELRAFLSNLSRAIEEQEAALQKLRQEHAALQLAWQRVRCRQRGIEKMRADWLRRRQLAAERRAQRELDDRAARRRPDKA